MVDHARYGPLVVPPGTARCLLTGCWSTAGGDVETEAREHTLATGHPTVHVPADDEAPDPG